MTGSAEAAYPVGDRVRLLVPLLGLRAHEVGTVVERHDRLCERTYLVEFDARRIELGDELLARARP